MAERWRCTVCHQTFKSWGTAATHWMAMHEQRAADHWAALQRAVQRVEG